MDSPTHVPEGAILDGRYKVLERLAPGTMAYVVRAHDPETDTEVACKIPLDMSAYKTEALLAQCKRLRRLGSRHLPAVLGFERHRTSEPHFPFLVMELVVGTELADWYVGKPLRTRLGVLAAVAETLHSLGSTHGDLFERNVLVTEGGRVVLIDPEAETFGSSRHSSTNGSDRIALSALVEGCLSVEERTRLSSTLRRFHDTSAEAPNPGEIGSALRHLLLLPYLPGDSAASLTELAVSHQQRTEDDRATFRRICEVRDLAFRGATDLFRQLAKPFKLVIPDRDAGAVVNDDLLLKQECESSDAGRGTLHHRHLNIRSQAGDELLFAFNGKSSFRLPWPHGRPGLIDTGWLNVLRDSEAISVEELELLDVDGHPQLFRVDPGPRRVDRPVRKFGEHAVDRAIRILLEVVYPGLRQAVLHPEGRATDPSLPILDREFLMPSFEHLGIARPDAPMDWLKGAIETAVRLPEHSETGNGIFGSEICLFFQGPHDYDIRRIQVKRATANLLQNHGHFFSPIYRFDVRVLDESSHRLRVELEGRVHTGEVVEWAFDFAV